MVWPAAYRITLPEGNMKVLKSGIVMKGRALYGIQGSRA
jgi:hypothetical protein